MEYLSIGKSKAILLKKNISKITYNSNLKFNTILNFRIFLSLYFFEISSLNSRVLLYSMFASEGLMDISGKTVRQIKNLNTRYEVKNQILSGLYKISAQNSKVFGYRDFLKNFFLDFELFDLKIRD